MSGRDRGTPTDRRGRTGDREPVGIRAARSACTAVAFAAAAFSLSVLLLLTADHLRFKSADPLNAEGLAALGEETRKGAAGEEIRLELRQLDLLARRAYFSSVTFRRKGSYLLLCGVVVILLAVKGRRSLAPQRPRPGPWPGREEPGSSAASARRLVALAGGVTAAGAVALFLLFSDIGPPPPVNRETGDPPPVGKSSEKGAGESGKEAEGDRRWEERVRQWPSFRGPDGLGLAFFPEAPLDWDGAEGRNVVWKAPVPRRGNSSPVVWGNRVFITGGDEKAREIFCYDAASGDLLWRYRVAGPPGSAVDIPEVTDDTGHAAPTAATDGRYVFAVFSTGDLVAVDFAGQLVWNRSLGRPDNPYGHAASLIIWENLLMVQYDHRLDARITAFDTSSGEIVWEQIRDTDISWSSPVLITGTQGPELVLNGNPAVVSYDPLTGVELWRVECMSGELAPSPAFAGGMVYVANEYARLAAINPGEPPVIAWEHLDGLPEVSSPVATEDYLFMANGAGVVTCLDRISGKLLWEEEFDEGFYASPIAAGDRVYLMDQTGMMRIIAAAGEFHLIGSPSLGEPSSATGAFLDGHLYLRGEEHLFRIGEGR